MDEDVLALSRRRRIFEHILRFPGSYLREMEKEMTLSVGDLQYHLHQLEKADLITSHMEGKRKRYFAQDKVGFSDRKILSLIKLKTPRKIVIFVLGNPDSTFREILSEFNFTKGALSFHLKKLMSVGILEKGKREKENVYRVADKEGILKVITTYKSSIMDEALDGFIDIWTKIG